MGAAGSDLWLCSAESLHNCQRLQRIRVNVHFGPGRNVYAREKRAGRGKRGRGRSYLSQVVFSFGWIWAGRRWMTILLYVCLSACRSAYRLLSNKIRWGERMWRWELGKMIIGSEYLDFLGSSPHLTSHHITSHHITSHHIISYHIISYHIISYHIISYHIISYHIISYHIISYHIISITSHYNRRRGWRKGIITSISRL